MLLMAWPVHVCAVDHSCHISTAQATSQRGWTLPKLADVKAKSKALESSGFTTVHSPKRRPFSRIALAQVPLQTPFPCYLHIGN